jgi:hypothetical protein
VRMCPDSYRDANVQVAYDFLKIYMNLIDIKTEVK